jgi:drug/metabolite transporter (DMT)-like permease
MKRPWLIGLLWSGLGSSLAAGYLIPYKAAAAEVGPAGLVLPMLLAASVINTVVDGVAQVRLRARARSGADGGGSARSAGAWKWDRTTWLVALVLGAASATGNEAVCRALLSINPGLVSVIIRTQVIFVAFGGLLLLREKVGPRFWIGVALALGGYLLLQGTVGTAGGVNPAGVAWAVLAAAGFAAMQLVVRPNVERIHPLQVNTMRLWMAAAMVALLPGRLGTVAQVGAHIWALAATAALCGPVLSRLSLMRALRYLPAAHATLALFTAPVFAYVLAGLVFGDWPGLLELLGGLVILAAVALPVPELARAQRLQHQPPDPQ